MPQLILDAQSRQPLKSNVEKKLEINLTPQFSKGELESAAAAASTAAAVGGAVAIWQVIMLIALGKALHSMWILINTLQLFVYISLWQIKFPGFSRPILFELRRMALGELIDDLEVGQKVQSMFGIENLGDNDFEVQKFGRERLGSAELTVNFGPTFLVVLCVIAVLTILAVLLYQLTKKCKLSTKWEERFKKLERRFLFNPMIRFLLLNSLKFNIMAMVTFASISSSQRASIASFCLAAAMLVMMNTLPFVFAHIVKKARDDLANEDRNQKYGTLYKGMRIEDLGEDEKKRNHQAHLYTCVWMLRRTLFAAITVILFNFPGVQMAAHQIVTIPYLVFLNRNEFFESR